MTLHEIAAQCEAAPVEQQREVLLHAFEAIHGPKPPRVHGGSDELTAWLAKFNPFFRKLDAEAYESAALMLCPEVLHIEWCEGFVEAVVWREPDHCYFHSGKAATAALALAAASCRAIQPPESRTEGERESRTCGLSSSPFVRRGRG